MSVLNKLVSYFPSLTSTGQGVEVYLLKLLQSYKHKENILLLRQSDEDMQKKIKLMLPCFTVAGTFNPRKEQWLISLSGLACIDLDSAEGYDTIYLLKQLRKIDCIAYAGLSCRGQRLFCIVVFKYPDKYKQHYNEIILAFERIGLPVDTCHKSISQARLVSWNDDNTQFFNHSAKPFASLAPQRTFHYVNPLPGNINQAAPENPFQWCVEQKNKSHSFTELKRHKYIIQLSRYCNLKGLSENETLNGCLQFVQKGFPESEITRIVKDIYASQSDSHAKHPFVRKAITSDSIPFQQPEHSEVPKDNQEQKEHTEIADKKETPPQQLTLIETSFTGRTGKFYVQNPVNLEKFAVYENEAAYNSRQHLPTYVDRLEAEEDFLRITPINLATLFTNQIINP